MVDQQAATHQWGRWSTAFESTREHEDPLAIEVTVAFTSPTGRVRSVLAFWDGDRTWRVRFCPDEVGTWHFASSCSDAQDHGLHRRSGSFNCDAYHGANPLYRSGAVTVAASGSHLSHTDGTPFFLLADTCWNGPMRSNEAEWEEYLSDRVSKGFSAVLFTAMQFRGCPDNAEGRVSFTGRERIQIDTEFFRRIDARSDAINDYGLLAIPLILHAGHDTALNAGHFLPEDQVIKLAKYVVARYGSHHVLWDLVAEGQFHGPDAEKWKRVGRAVFPEPPHAPVTIHPWGMDLALDAFRDEPWLTVAGYQSAHGDNEKSLRWIPEGEPATEWRLPPARPFINLEPPYEGHLSTTSKKPFDAAAVRRAMFWSLLASPTAGVAYGGHGVWGWDDGKGAPFGHDWTGSAPHWRDALNLPGAQSLQHVRRLFNDLPWWSLRPAPEMLADQPGTTDPRHTVVASRTEVSSTIVVYVPEGSQVALRSDDIPDSSAATWLDPRTGERHNVEAPHADGEWRPVMPDGNDWVLLVSDGSY